jgi:K+-transporting ATPase A subunit
MTKKDKIIGYVIIQIVATITWLLYFISLIILLSLVVQGYKDSFNKEEQSLKEQCLIEAINKKDKESYVFKC